MLSLRSCPSEIIILIGDTPVFIPLQDKMGQPRFAGGFVMENKCSMLLKF